MSLLRCMTAAMMTQVRFAGSKGTKIMRLHGEQFKNESTDINNPYLWDPDYMPSDESDFDRDPIEVRLREPLPYEQFIPREQVLKRMIKLLEGMERAKTDDVVLTENTHLMNDLSMDSLDLVEFSLGLEDEFEIEIPDEEAEQIVTLGDAVELVHDHPHAS